MERGWRVQTHIRKYSSSSGLSVSTTRQHLLYTWNKKCSPLKQEILNILKGFAVTNRVLILELSIVFHRRAGKYFSFVLVHQFYCHWFNQLLQSGECRQLQQCTSRYCENKTKKKTADLVCKKEVIQLKMATSSSNIRRAILLGTKETPETSWTEYLNNNLCLIFNGLKVCVISEKTSDEVLDNTKIKEVSNFSNELS